MERVAVTVWRDRVSPVFESCSQYLFADCHRGEVSRQTRCDCAALDQFGRLLALFEHEATVLLCGAITEASANIIQAQGIAIVPFITGRADAILEAYLRGRLHSPRFALPGCRPRKRRRFRGGR